MVLEPIIVNVRVEADAPLFQMVVTEVDITTISPELELMNNTTHSDTYLGIQELLPFIRR